MKKSTLIFFLLSCFMAAIACSDEKPGHRDVMKAFELRMSGKVDEAKALLEEVISGDSTNAMAHYEMARMNYYLLTGGGRTKIEDILHPIQKAVALDPENVTYAYYHAIAGFLNAFMSMQMGQQDKVKERLGETCKLFEKVLELKPDYREPMLYLVEIYGMLPPEMGGDSLKAIAWAGKLAATDKYFGARAKAALLPEGSNMVKFWEDQIIMNGRTPDLLRQAGIACLFEDKPEQAEKLFEEAMTTEPSKSLGMLDLGRYHMMKVMQNKDLAATELPVARIWFEKYLQAEPEPIVPLRAYTHGLLAKIAMFTGNQEEGKKQMD